MPLSEPEKGLVHTLYKKKEVDKLFSNCREYTIERKGSEWITNATHAVQIKSKNYEQVKHYRGEIGCLLYIDIT